MKSPHLSAITEMLGTSFENLNLRAAGLNHFSVLLEASYKDSGRDAYGDAPRHRTRSPACRASDIPGVYHTHGKRVQTEAGRRVMRWAAKTALIPGLTTSVQGNS